MPHLHPIYTEKTNCRDCYKCIRHCPVKAICVDNHSAEVNQTLCVSCGNCTRVCPAKAKIIRNDLAWTRYLVKSDCVVASVAPSFTAEFTEISFAQLASALGMLGFTYTSQASIGAAVVNNLTAEYLDKQSSGIYYSTSCPTVVDTIFKYFPHLQAGLVPVPSPMTVHARLLRQELGADTKVVFIGPCASKKREAELVDQSADAVITFAELREWFKLQKIKIEEAELPVQIIDFDNQLAAEYPLHGGMIAGLKPLLKNSDISLMSFSGLDNIYHSLATLSDLDSPKEFIFCELLACENGCLNGPGMTNCDSDIIKAAHVSEYARTIDKTKETTCALILENKDSLWVEAKTIEKASFTDEAIHESLRTVGKFSLNDELNCGGCGYYTCREFALAMLRQNAEPEMCVSYMRKIAADKASALLQKIPYGVVMANEKMQIVDCNEKFAQMLGGDVPIMFEAKPGLKGADLTKTISFHRYFSDLMQSSEETANFDVRDSSGFYSLSIFTLQKSKLVCGILQNLHEPEIRREMVLERTQQVIKHNLETVQQIAGMLGENAAFTESMLNSIHEAFELNNPNK